MDISYDGSGHDPGRLMSRRQYFQFHVIPVKGQHRAFRVSDGHQHSAGYLLDSRQLHTANVAADVPTLVIPLWDVFKTIFILLGIPLTLGILFAHFLPKVADKLKKPFQWLSILFFIAMVILSFAGNLDAFLKCVKYIFLIVFIHNLLALGIGFGIGTTFKVPRRDRRTLTIETGIQNSGLGLVLLLGTSIFAGFPPHGGMLVITAWWGIWHIISGLTVSTIFNLKDKRSAK